MCWMFYKKFNQIYLTDKIAVIFAIKWTWLRIINEILHVALHYIVSK